MKPREKLIHLLGGVTEQECKARVKTATDVHTWYCSELLNSECHCIAEQMRKEELLRKPVKFQKWEG